MPDEPKTDRKADIYYARVGNAPPRLIRATDSRLARKHALASVHPPEVEVRRPTTEEAMDMALDGIVVEDATVEPAPPPAEPDLLNDGRPDLTDPERINPEDDA